MISRRKPWLWIATIIVLVAGGSWFLSRDAAPARQHPVRSKAAAASDLTAPVDTGKESFEFPFLGKVIATAKMERIHCGSEREGGRTIQVKVFYNDEGTFLAC
jgi:hypothetical protein